MLGGAERIAADAPAVATAAPSSLGPQELVENSAKRMLQELDANRPMYQKDPAKLDSLVANVLLPNFDTEYAARLVLGQTWRTATPEQRKRFVDAFYHSLLHNYGNALVDFTADRFVILPYKGDPNETSATVQNRGQTVFGREGARQFQPAQSRWTLESLGRGHRGNFVRQKFPHRFWIGDSAERAG